MNNIGLVSRTNSTRSVIALGDVRFGEGLVVIAGPCSVESEEQTLRIARAVKAAGAHMLRGGCSSREPRPTPSRASD